MLPAKQNKAYTEFHKKQGFLECGRFQNIVQKHGNTFDVVWMQKFI
jgi:L-amino acid N-acyltransferase YncA